MTVKVKNISGLEDYGTSIHRFAGKFEEVSSDTMREFNKIGRASRRERVFRAV